MPWSGSAGSQTFSRTNGTNTGSTAWQLDKAAGTKIVANRHDVHDQDLADGINAALKKDGGNKPTANIDFDGFKPTNLGTPAASGDAATKGYVDTADALKWGQNVQVFAASGTFNVPAGVSSVFVEVWGAGGGGAVSGAGGTAGGTSSFGALASATGGGGGGASANVGGTGGTGSGPSESIQGGKGQNAGTGETTAGIGGSAPKGGAGGPDGGSPNGLVPGGGGRGNQNGAGGAGGYAAGWVSVTPGGSVTVTVGAGGSAGGAGAGAGAAGRVIVRW